jgi:RHS repeat-associated protein
MLNYKHVLHSVAQFARNNGQRAGLLCLLLLFLVSSFTPSASAIIAEAQQAQANQQAAGSQQPFPNHAKVPTNTHTHQLADADAKKTMKQNYPAGQQAVVSDKPAATDAHPGSTSFLDTVHATNKNAGINVPGQALQGIEKPAKITPHELQDKRTASSTATLNADGSVTTKEFVSPQFFKKDGKWINIDTTLTEDTNAGDAGNIVGRALGHAESLFSSPNNFTVTGNDWQARFSPSDASKGMVRIQQGSDQVGFSPLHANTVNPAIITDKDGHQTVRYANLWDGVDVEYVVQNAAIKENVIIKNKDAANSVSFTLIGANLKKNLSADPNAPAYIIDGALGNQFSIASANLILNGSGLVTEAGKFSQTYQGNTITLRVDADFLKDLPAKAFPAVIDPGVFRSTYGTRYGGVNYVSFKTDGYVCPWTVCNTYVGSLYDSNNRLQYWRSAYFAPYDQFRNSNTVLMNATLHLEQLSSSHWTGTTATHNFQLGHATCLNSFNCVDGVWHSANIGTSGNMDVTNLYNYLISVGDFGGWAMLMGEDGTTSSYKEFNPDNDYIDFTYGGTPTPPSVTSPESGQVYVDPQPSFTIGAVSNPNGSTPLQYEILVSTGAGASGGLITSGRQAALQWTMPDNILQDGSTYYVQARSFDPITGLYSGWGASVPFRIDLRTGKDKTQTFDSLGPVDVDLATGNVMTSASSHTSSALGGSLGVSLDYNTPLKSRAGLVGRYWNVAAGYTGGLPSTTPTMTRVDQAVDFNWGTGSPSAGTMNNDWFYAAWDGNFVAPQTGTYYFGGNNDDSLNIKVNSQQLYANAGCYSGICYGSSISLTAGQVVPIHVEYQEATDPAYAHLYVKTPDGVDQLAPQAWLQTGVRPTSQQYGLTGSYFGNFDGTSTFSAANSLIMKRTDPYLNFNWGTGAPMPNGPDSFLVRWYGYVTVPVSGTYTFGARSDDGTKIMLGNGNTPVYTDWTSHGAPASPNWGTTYPLTANTPVPITIEYYDAGGPASFELWAQGPVAAQIVPSTWLSPKAQVLPDGWNLGIDPDGDLNYDHIKINQSSVVLTDSTGDTHEYKWDDTKKAYTPPVNDAGLLVRNADGTYTMQDTDGRTYVFAADGTLKSVTSPVDDRKPAALQYNYTSPTGGPAVLTQITDAVDNSRWLQVYYSGDGNCGAAPAGYDATAPAGMLCAVKTNDGRATYFYYIQGQLARIQKPGNEITDYRYEAVQNSGVTIGYRINSIRDSLATDAIAAGVRADDDTTKSQLSYDVLGRVTSVTQPAASAGDTRIQHTIEYLPGAADKSYYGATQQHIVGATEPNGFTHRVEYDNLFRTTRDTDIANLSDTSQWDAVKDLLYSTTDEVGLKTTTVYDDEDRAVNSYGPAPAAWFDSTNPKAQVPLSSYAAQVPRTDTAFDQNIVGPAVAWFDYTKQTGNTSGVLSGAPKLHATGINTSTPGTLSYDFATPPVTASSGAQGIGLSATGKLRLPNGTYTISADTSDGIRVWVDDTIVLDGQWIDSGYRTVASNTFTITDAAPKRFRLDAYRRTGSTGALNVRIQQSGGFAATTDWSNYLKPDYSLTTSTKVYDSTLGNSTNTTSYGSNPELGLAQSSTVDAGGLNLTTASTYETQGATGSFLRQTAKYLPGANAAVASTATQYGYYGATETRDNPCTTGMTEAYKQAGFLKLKTEPDPDGAGSQTPRTTETIYDDTGRVVATRNNNDSWTCTAYDSRGRVLTTVIPAFGSEGGRTVTNNYAVSGNPLTSSSYDSNGAVVTTIDLLGRTVSYTDDYNDTTTSSYDAQGRLAGRNSPMGAEVFIYDNYSRLSDQKLDGVTYAHVTYDQYGRTDHVDYPDAGQARLTPARDLLGRQNSLTYTPGTSAMSPSNLLQNPSFEQHAQGDPTQPYSWQQGQWGNNTATLSYVNDAHTGSHGLKVDITSYTDGDAKWYDASPVVANPSTAYTFRDYYKSTTASSVVMEYTRSDGSIYYNWIGALPANGNWTQSTFTFTTPSDAVKLSPMHLISSVGSLTTDDLEVFQSNQGAVGSTAAVTDTVTRTQAGQITSDTVTSGSSSLAYSYGYDTAGRLTSANIGPHIYSYGYGQQSSSCGTANNMNPNSGKNSNRTSQIMDGVTTTYCYDYADRLISSSNPAASGVLYDSRGGMTQIGTGSTPLYMGYDSSGRNWGFEQYTDSGNGAGMYYDRDVQGRIIGRYSDSISGWNWNSNGMWFYGFTGSGDTPDYVRDADWNITEKYLQLPGGVVVTIKPRAPKLTDKVTYNMPNIHGDVLLTLNALGANISNSNGPAGAFTYDPFGNMVTGGVLPSTGDMDSYGYVGQHQKLTETNFAFTPIQMGVRVYLPTLGRFTQVDSVEGGTPNNYVYPPDPINEFDLTGEFGFGDAMKWVGKHSDAIGMGIAAVGLGACIVATAGICAGVAVGAAVAGGAVSGLGSYSRSGDVRKAIGTGVVSAGISMLGIKKITVAGKVVSKGLPNAVRWFGAGRNYVSAGKALSKIPGQQRLKAQAVRFVRQEAVKGAFAAYHKYGR